MTESSVAAQPQTRPPRRTVREPGGIGRAVITVLVVGAVVAIVWVVLASKVIDWSVVGSYLTAGTVLDGVVVTLELTVLSMLIGVVLGAALALLLRSRTPALRWFAAGYIWLFRGTPVLVQLLIWFNLSLVVPRLGWGDFSIDTNTVITPFIAAVLGLGLNEGAYMSEILRAGIQSVDRGQTEAALATGMRPGQVMRRVVLPQALRLVIPPTGNQAIGMLKTTSLVSVIAANDLLTTVQHIYAQNFRIIDLLVVACIWYLAMTTIATYLQSLLERRFDDARKPRAIAPTEGAAP